jgi:hypothetical protein
MPPRGIWLRTTVGCHLSRDFAAFAMPSDAIHLR